MQFTPCFMSTACIMNAERKIRLNRERRLWRLRLIYVPMGWSRRVLVTLQTPVLIRIGIRRCTTPTEEEPEEISGEEEGV